MQMATICVCPSGAEIQSFSNIQFSTHATIAGINEYQWNNVVPAGNLLMQTPNLRLLESLHAGTLDFRYVIAKENDTTLGVLYFQVVRFEAAQLLNYFPENKYQWLKGISSSILNRINARLLVSGNVFMTGENGYYFTNGVDEAKKAAVLRLAVRQIMREDNSINAVLISDLYEPKSVFDEKFRMHGYHQITVESDMSLHIRPEWKTMDDYLNSFSSKYRVRAKKVFTLCRDAGVEIRELSATEIAIYQNTLYELYNNVIANADFKLATLSPDFFAQQKQLMPQNYRLFAYFRADEMIGFISAFNFSKRMEVHYTGMKHDVSRPIHLYQHMMYDMVKVGIESGAERLHFGRTAPEIKSTIGALPSPMYGYLKHRNPAFNFMLVKPYTANLKPKEYIFRNPFK